MNWKTQPATNKPSTHHQHCGRHIATGIMSMETAIMGMPMVWHARFTGFLWLVEYCLIHSSRLLPSIVYPPLCDSSGGSGESVSIPHHAPKQARKAQARRQQELPPLFFGEQP